MRMRVEETKEEWSFPSLQLEVAATLVTSKREESCSELERSQAVDKCSGGGTRANGGLGGDSTCQ